MFKRFLPIIIAVSLVFTSTAFPYTSAPKRTLSNLTYSLSNRYNDPYVNGVFADNILLTLAYMDGKVKEGQKVQWNKVEDSGVTTLILKPGQTFAFHDTVLEKYKGKVVSTTNTHFNSRDGFKSDGWLVGDGVCHLASFMYVASLTAGLEAEAPTRHDFAKIEDVPQKYGVSIYYTPNDAKTSTLQNLYITNNQPKTIAFVFTHDQDSLNIKVETLN
jgi:hypothetical protein